MSNLITHIPNRLSLLQEKILHLRQTNQLELQHGDWGYASAPSNIALLKYWGKQPGQMQIPTNSSLSLTLGGFRSFTRVTALGRFFPTQEQSHIAKFPYKFLLKNENKAIISEKIPQKMELFLNSLLYPFAPEIALQVESQNNFPTACGIASSASGYAALVSAIADLLQLPKHFTHEELQYWLSEWSRIGSGSATRSSLLQNNSLFVAWKLMEHENNIFTTTENLKHHQNWRYLKHCVLVLDENEKSISSSDGHRYAQTSPLHAIRVAGINFKLTHMLKALEEFDFATLQQITEEDAFFMHAVMQTGEQPACYLNMQVSKIIAQFVQYRDQNGLQACWTLDAGPNVHFLYLEQDEKRIFEFFKKFQNYENKKIKILQNQFGDEQVFIGERS